MTIGVFESPPPLPPSLPPSRLPPLLDRRRNDVDMTSLLVGRLPPGEQNGSDGGRREGVGVYVYVSRAFRLLEI